MTCLVRKIVLSSPYKSLDIYLLIFQNNLLFISISVYLLYSLLKLPKFSILYPKPQQCPKLAESQCLLTLNIASPNKYMPEFTIIKSSIRKCKILVNLIISKINAAIFEKFLFREFGPLPQIRPLKQFDLYSCLILKGANLYYSNFAFL